MNRTTMQPYIVYVLPDNENRVTAINSSAFLPDPTGWVKIDQGFGDKYHHAQGNYLSGPLRDDRGVCRYKLEGSEVQERSQEEMDADWVEPEAQPTTEERLSAMEAAGLERDLALMELASALTGLMEGGNI